MQSASNYRLSEWQEYNNDQSLQARHPTGDDLVVGKSVEPVKSKHSNTAGKRAARNGFKTLEAETACQEHDNTKFTERRRQENLSPEGPAFDNAFQARAKPTVGRREPKSSEMQNRLPQEETKYIVDDPERYSKMKNNANEPGRKNQRSTDTNKLPIQESSEPRIVKVPVSSKAHPIQDNHRSSNAAQERYLGEGLALDRSILKENRGRQFVQVDLQTLSKDLMKEPEPNESEQWPHDSKPYPTTEGLPKSLGATGEPCLQVKLVTDQSGFEETSGTHPVRPKNQHNRLSDEYVIRRPFAGRRDTPLSESEIAKHLNTINEDGGHFAMNNATAKEAFESSDQVRTFRAKASSPKSNARTEYDVFKPTYQVKSAPGKALTSSSALHQSMAKPIPGRYDAQKNTFSGLARGLLGKKAEDRSDGLGLPRMMKQHQYEHQANTPRYAGAIEERTTPKGGAVDRPQVAGTSRAFGSTKDSGDDYGSGSRGPMNDFVNQDYEDVKSLNGMYDDEADSYNEDSSSYQDGNDDDHALDSRTEDSDIGDQAYSDVDACSTPNRSCYDDTSNGGGSQGSFAGDQGDFADYSDNCSVSDGDGSGSDANTGRCTDGGEDSDAETVDTNESGAPSRISSDSRSDNNDIDDEDNGESGLEAYGSDGEPENVGEAASGDDGFSDEGEYGEDNISGEVYESEESPLSEENSGSETEGKSGEEEQSEIEYGSGEASESEDEAASGDEVSAGDEGFSGGSEYREDSRSGGEDISGVEALSEVDSNSETEARPEEEEQSEIDYRSGEESGSEDEAASGDEVSAGDESFSGESVDGEDSQSEAENQYGGEAGSEKNSHSELEGRSSEEEQQSEDEAFSGEETGAREGDYRSGEDAFSEDERESEENSGSETRGNGSSEGSELVDETVSEGESGSKEQEDDSGEETCYGDERQSERYPDSEPGDEETGSSEGDTEGNSEDEHESERYSGSETGDNKADSDNESSSDEQPTPSESPNPFPFPPATSSQPHHTPDDFPPLGNPPPINENTPAPSNTYAAVLKRKAPEASSSLLNAPADAVLEPKKKRRRRRRARGVDDGCGGIGDDIEDRLSDEYGYTVVRRGGRGGGRLPAEERAVMPRGGRGGGRR